MPLPAVPVAPKWPAVTVHAASAVPSPLFPKFQVGTVPEFAEVIASASVPEVRTRSFSGFFFMIINLVFVDSIF